MILLFFTLGLSLSLGLNFLRILGRPFLLELLGLLLRLAKGITPNRLALAKPFVGGR
jgi:hypothetical protein